MPFFRTGISFIFYQYLTYHCLLKPFFVEHKLPIWVQHQIHHTMQQTEELQCQQAISDPNLSPDAFFSYMCLWHATVLCSVKKNVSGVKQQS